MSCYEISERTLGRVRFGLEINACGLLDALQGVCACSAACILQELHELNVAAVNARYGTEDDHGETEQVKAVPCSIIQLVKSCQCLQYNMCEGTIAGHELTLRLDAWFIGVRETLKACGKWSDAEYQACEWDG